MEGVYKILFLIISPFFAVASAFSLVAIFIYKKQLVTEDELSEDKIYVYKLKYNNDFENLEGKEQTVDELNSLSTRLFSEKTPDGEVTMAYNNKFESFWYYAETKNINYQYLEVVAKGYAIKYDCKCVYVNNRNTEEERSGLVLTSSKISDVFVKLKPKPSNIVKYDTQFEEKNIFTYKGDVKRINEDNNRVNTTNPNIDFAYYKKQMKTKE